MFRLFTALFLLAAASVGAHAQSLQVPSYWQNQRGSELKLYSIDAQGKLTGVYVSHTGGCQYAPFPLTGLVQGTHIRFVVVWANGVLNCNSRTLWHGHVIGKTMNTRWTLTGTGIPVPITGIDIFHQQP
jgi:hypothetical protein